jgi:hypothetical protein
MNDYNEDLDRDVEDIISQLKNHNHKTSTIEKDRPDLSKDDIEKFVIDNASSVISNCVDMLQTLSKDVGTGAVDAKMVESIAELAKATTSAIDALSKLKLAEDKLKGQKEIKQMDIDSKNNVMKLMNIGTENLLSREELLRTKLLPTDSEKEKAVIDV